jgi:hypothetical protein
MGIAHAASPASPGAPSFLDLPAEIRNAIYELLFKRGRRAYMHNIHAYYTKMPQPDYYPDDSEYEYEFEEDYEDDREIKSTHCRLVKPMRPKSRRHVRICLNIFVRKSLQEVR